MESGSSSVGTNKVRRGSGSGTRRSWKPSEERVLMDLLKELIAGGGWKSENGFRPGFLYRLEGMIKDKIKDTDLRGTPHIQSRITIWKRHHVALQTALADSGGGFNSETKIIDVSDIAWEKAVKREPTVASMRYKPWPFYYDWIKVFGNDGATGGASQTVNDAVEDILSEELPGEAFATYLNEDITIEPDNAGVCDMDVESHAPNVQAFTSAAPPPITKKMTQPPPGNNNKELLDGLSVLFKSSDDRFDQIVHTLVSPVQGVAQSHPQAEGNSHPIILNRSQVYCVLDSMPELTVDQRLSAADKITKKSRILEVFSGLPETVRFRYVERLLNGDFDNED